MCIVLNWSELWVVIDSKLSTSSNWMAHRSKVSLPLCRHHTDRKQDFSGFAWEEPIQKEDTLKDTLWLSPTFQVYPQIISAQMGEKRMVVRTL